MKRTSLVLSLIAFCGFNNAYAQKNFDLKVWPDGPKIESKNPNQTRLIKTGLLNNNNEATLEVFLPNSDTKTPMIVICPGGGYMNLSIDSEGSDFAPWLNERGIAVAVLNYRMPAGVNEIPLSDLQKTLTLIRENSAEWNINSNKVGVMGFSAGGHLAAMGAVSGEGMTKPDFQVLFYPVISMTDTITHKGSKKNLLGANQNNSKLVEYYSADKRVDKNTPPAFIVLADDDNAVIPMNSILYYSALKNHNIPAELHIYPSGGHGWGFKPTFEYRDEWQNALDEWLEKTLDNN